MASGSQKFIARNRAPRVQIEYDVELYGAEKKVQLPFVMGVMSDLAGKSETPQPSVADRKFLEIDVDNFDQRMKAMRPRAAFTVPNTLTGEGTLPVDLTFESMADFSPAEIARKIEPLRVLLEARTQLSNLMTYMDGKTGAETLIENALQDMTLLSAIASRPADAGEKDRALAALRQQAPDPDAPDADAAEKATALSALRAETPVAEDAPDDKDAALAALRAATPVAEDAPDDKGAALAALRAATPVAEDAADDKGAALAALRAATPVAEDAPDDKDAALAALRAAIPVTEDAPDDKGAALAALRAATPVAEDAADDKGASLWVATPVAEDAIDEPLVDILDDDLLAAPEPAAADPLDGLDDLLAAPEPAEDDPWGNLDDLLGGLDEPLPAPAAPVDDDPLAGLDDLFAETTGAGQAGDDPLEGIDDLLSGIDDLLAGPDTAPQPKDADMSLLDDLMGAPPAATPPNNPFGTISAPAPGAEALQRPKFRMAIFGDFSGRSARGLIEIGDALAARRAIALDVDTVEEVIEGFATTLVLPIGPDGKGIEVRLNELDDLHPDELVDNLELFEALKGLRQRLSNARTAESAVREMQGWGESFTAPVKSTHRFSASANIPADRKLSDFQQLIGDTAGRLTQASPIDDLIGRIIGPYVVPGPNPEAMALVENVDQAMSQALRLVLHHPDFQALEAQWRSLDLLARRVETDVKLEITLYDISAEEIATDLAQSDDLAQSGLFRLLNAPLQEEGGIGFSAMFGMYTFEETPPHAEILARVAQIAEHIRAPFFAAISPGFMNTEAKDRHPLVATAWDELRRQSAAGYLGLVAPRFLLRRPYGRKTDPIDAFDFEEFTEKEGLSGMLWANPTVLVAVLLAQAWKDGGRQMTLGKVMSLDDIPYHYVTDKHGDQIALPCTERNITESKNQLVMGRGFMPVVSMRGRDVIRLASFQSVAGTEIAGPWSDAAPKAAAVKAAGLNVEMTIPQEAPPAAGGDGMDDLDALLAGFGDDAAPTDPGDIDADLAALLEGL